MKFNYNRSDIGIYNISRDNNIVSRLQERNTRDPTRRDLQGVIYYYFTDIFPLFNINGGILKLFFTDNSFEF